MRSGAQLTGRTSERATLRAALESPDAELICVYGRRRVGKTFLIRELFAVELVFELTGVFGAPLREQLASFQRTFDATFRGPEEAPPETWPEAFDRLSRGLDRLPKTKKRRAVFLDEVPWLASRRSGFLRAFEHFWNAWAAKRPWICVVVCGSAAAWMIDNLLDARGGLHNRVTRRVRLEPFTLGEARAFLASRRIELGDFQTLELYMAMGGVPHYLKEVRRGESSSQAIDRICFARDGLLRDEMGRVYRSLFEHAERHEAVVRALAERPS